MLQISDIEALVQYHLRRSDQLISTGTELAITNFVFRRFVALLNWEDYTKIYPLPTLTTAGLKTYPWPSQPNFNNVLSLEIQDHANALVYKRIVNARSVKEWLALESAPDDLPLQFRIYKGLLTDDATLEVRPGPIASGLIMRIDGLVEPTPFVSTIERTGFRNAGIDDAFALVLAGVFAAKLGQQERSQQLIAWGGDTIRLNTGKEISPDEIREQLRL